MEYVNLYLKTEYSLLNSTCRILDTVTLAKKLGYDSLAITDEYNMHGVIKFYRACKANDLKPIIGLKIKYQYNEIISEILLYAMSDFGYLNLINICSNAKLNNNIVDFDYLAKCSNGLLVIFPSFENIIYQNIVHNNILEAKIHYNLFKAEFINVYLGIAKTNAIERKNYPNVVEQAKSLGIELVGLVDTCILNNEDELGLEVLRKIQNPDYQAEEFLNNQFHNPEELKLEFKEYPVLLENTIKIASLCNVTIEFGRYQFPKYGDEINATQYLQNLCLKGLEKRLKTHQYTIDNQYNQMDYYNRLKYELKIIDEMGFSDYFLIVWDFVKYAKKQNILVGPGRGSGPASLVAYCLGITNIDPLEYGLIFERFLNRERISMPDIDIDFQDDRRDEVIKYVASRYGKHRVAHIITFGTFGQKSSLREAARILKLSDLKFKQISKELKNTRQQTLKTIVQQNEVILELMNNYPDIEKVVQAAILIEGLPRNTSTHAAGIIIARDSLAHSTPIQEGLNGIYQTQYEASDLESLGLLKIDFLGLINLTNIAKCIENIKVVEPDFKMPNVMKDPATYEMIAQGDVQGVFQLESEGMRNTLIKMKVSNINDIIQSIALYRPGPMEIIPTFIKRKDGLEKVIYPHPDLSDILRETYGTIVYQEQIMMIARKFAGYSYGEADVLRVAVTKKRKSEMEKSRTKFIVSAINNGYDRDTAILIFEYIEKFANYGFNKAHSTAYALITYQTAYLKRHYYPYYFATLMSAYRDSDTALKAYYLDALNRNIPISCPDIRKCNTSFIYMDKMIIFPLNTIQGIGNVKVDQLAELQPFNKYDDFVLKTKRILSKQNVESLIYASALDCFGLTKKTMINNYDNILNMEKYSHISTIIPITYDLTEFEYGYLVEKEKEVMGFNIKYNFFYQYNGIFQHKNLQRIKDLEYNQYAKTLGLINNIKVIKTKSNERMAFAKLSDDVSAIDVVFFPEVYANSQISNDQIVKITGNIQVRDNRKQIVADSIEKL